MNHIRFRDATSRRLRSRPNLTRRTGAPDRVDHNHLLFIQRNRARQSVKSHIRTPINFNVFSYWPDKRRSRERSTPMQFPRTARAVSRSKTVQRYEWFVITTWRIDSRPSLKSKSDGSATANGSILFGSDFQQVRVHIVFISFSTTNNVPPGIARFPVLLCSIWCSIFQSI